MKLPTPELLTGSLAQTKSYLLRLVRALDAELTALRARKPEVDMDKIISAVAQSDVVLDAVYRYCENRRAKEENSDEVAE